jgi:GT2 family glycosyltransferase
MTLQSFSAVTGACLVVNKAVYESVNGLDADHLPVAFNDIDLCIRIQQQGFRNVWTPYAELYHHESATRGSDLSPEKRARFEREVRYMQDRWLALLESDPHYNPNLSLTGNVFDLAFPPRTTT